MMMTNSKDFLSKAKRKKEAKEMAESMEVLKSEMLHFISAASNIMTVLEEHGKSIAYLLSKDKDWLEANKELLAEYDELAKGKPSDDNKQETA